MVVILTGIRWNLSIVLIYICLKIKDVECILIHLLAIWISSFEKSLLSSFAHLFIGYVGFGLLSLSLCILYIDPLLEE